MREARSIGPGSASEEDQVFRLLALCTQRPGDPGIAVRLASALAAAPPEIDLARFSEEQGVASLLLAHIRDARLPVDPSLVVRLFALNRRHLHAAAVRRRIVGEAVTALTEADIPLLVLKGAALAQLVYSDSTRRPMRDVDLLVPARDARRAYETLRGIGFAPSEKETAPDHHHLPGLFKTADGTSIIVELHHQLLPTTPFVAAAGYENLAGAAQTFEWDGLSLQTLGREDMIWHVYSHAFVINTLCPAIRLISLADLIHTVEAWVDLLDWNVLERRYGRMVRALPMVQQLVPWSQRVAATLRVQTARSVSGPRSVMPSLRWSAVASRDVLWPSEWWFRMRYGIDGPWRWIWYRGAGHPLRVGMAAAGTATRRISRHLGLARPRPLLDGRLPGIG